IDENQAFHADWRINATPRLSFTLVNWDHWSITGVGRATPVNDFVFQPEVLAPGATLIVYLNTPTGKVPCWMSPELYALESKNVILPLERMSVFFTQAKATTGSMISKDKYLEFIVEFGQHENLTYKLENGRDWVKVS
ncbi:hypothetical protein H0H92_010332, partial [Tricholoma furcatifolium]